jgi:hypothetical protein
VQGLVFCSKTDHKKQRYQRKAIFQIREKMIVSGASKNMFNLKNQNIYTAPKVKLFSKSL